MSILTTEDLTRRVGEPKAVSGLSVPPRVTPDNDRRPILAVSNLSKGFGKVTAVDAINFEVFEGEIFGLVGLNGAGKTTTMLILSSLLNPDSGNATLCGYDVVKEKDSVRRSIGFVFEEEAVDIYLTGKQNLDFAARMYSLPKQEREKRVAEVLKTVGLEQHANAKVRDYSGGMLRRLEIARGMLTSPKVLLLDEPTIGLDVQTRRYLWDYLRRVNKEMGATVLLATSYLEEADYLCNRIAILHEGKIVALNTPEALKGSIGENLITLKVSKGSQEEFAELLIGENLVMPELSKGPQEEFAELLREMPWAKSVESHDGALVLSLMDKSIGIPEIVRLAKTHGFSISSIKSSTPNLNDVLLHYVKKSVEEHDG
ncbi:MAG: ATP-binding cassette domain-containing protein [Halobacteriota archaeon]|jgi:ABC-2 type transport system ATP-binding protein